MRVSTGLTSPGPAEQRIREQIAAREASIARRARYKYSRRLELPEQDRREMHHHFVVVHGRAGEAYRGRKPGMHLGAFALLIIAVAVVAVVVGTL